MEKYKVLIVDDEEPARELLQTYVSKLDYLELSGTCSNALEAKKAIDEGGIDILLTDIQMDDLTGIDLVKNLKNQPVTIITTAYSEYALEGYELDVVDYLVKPISFQRFCRAIDKAMELFKFNNGLAEKENATHATADQPSDYFFVKTNRKMVKVAYDELLFVESYGEYVKLYTHDDVLLALQTMGFMESMLPNERFLRIHRSHIVNLDHVKEVDGNTVVLDSHELIISKRMRESFVATLAGKGLI